MRKLKVLVIEDDVNQMELLVPQLNKIGLQEIIFATDRISISEFLRVEQAPLLLVFTDKMDDITLSNYLNQESLRTMLYL